MSPPPVQNNLNFCARRGMCYSSLYSVTPTPKFLDQPLNKALTSKKFIPVFRGGASEASRVTFTDHVAGARDVMRACMYVCIRASSPWANYAHVQMVLSQQFAKLLSSGKETLGKKISCSGVDSNWGLIRCIADHCLHHRANGALAALGFKFGSYTVDYCSEC